MISCLSFTGDYISLAKWCRKQVGNREFRIRKSKTIRSQEWNYLMKRFNAWTMRISSGAGKIYFSVVCVCIFICLMGAKFVGRRSFCKAIDRTKYVYSHHLWVCTSTGPNLFAYSIIGLGTCERGVLEQKKALVTYRNFLALPNLQSFSCSSLSNMHKQEDIRPPFTEKPVLLMDDPFWRHPRLSDKQKREALVAHILDVGKYLLVRTLINNNNTLRLLIRTLINAAAVHGTTKIPDLQHHYKCKSKQRHRKLWCWIEVPVR